MSLVNQIMRNFSKVVQSKGSAKYQDNTKNVELRGTYLEGRSQDLPNMIFFSEHCDPVENWKSFFTNPDNKVLNHRNIWLVNPRNFGNSDRNSSFCLSEQADDVQRFMWQNKITTATLAGHGFGGRLAVATGCYHADRVSGVYAIESSPMDMRYHDSFKEFKNYIHKLNSINLKDIDQKDLDSFLKEEIECPKWRSSFKQNIVKDEKGNRSWGFEMNYLNANLKMNKADSIGYWAQRHGLFTGRASFIFNEYSHWIHLNTNTLPMHHICPRVKGFGHDIHMIQGDENSLNHWIYDFKQPSFTLDRKFAKFLHMWDGVQVLLKDRSEIGRFFIPDRKGSRNDPEHVQSDYSPSHYHHNWRYSNVYEEQAKRDAENN